MPKTELQTKLQDLRNTTGLSTADFASAIGLPTTSYAYYEQRYKKPYLPPDIIGKLAGAAEMLGLDLKAINALSVAPVSIVEASRKRMPRVGFGDGPDASAVFPTADLPILGGARGGIGVFMDNGDRLGDTMRPLTLIGVKDAYAVYLDGDSMEPRYYAGELALVHPHKVVTRGCFVVVQYDEDGERHYTLKRFIKRSGGELHLEQLNPEEPWVMPLDKVHAVHRVVGSIDT